MSLTFDKVYHASVVGIGTAVFASADRASVDIADLGAFELHTSILVVSAS